MSKKDTRDRDKRRRRAQKRAMKRTRHEKKVANMKKAQRASGAKMKEALDIVGKKMTPVQQKNMKMTIYTLWRNLMLFLRKLGCKVGIHDWKLCSGKPGDPKYACVRCWARSKKEWGEGSEAYYKNKEKAQADKLVAERLKHGTKVHHAKDESKEESQKET